MKKTICSFVVALFLCFSVVFGSNFVSADTVSVSALTINDGYTNYIELSGYGYKTKNTFSLSPCCKYMITNNGLMTADCSVKLTNMSNFNIKYKVEFWSATSIIANTGISIVAAGYDSSVSCLFDSDVMSVLDHIILYVDSLSIGIVCSVNIVFSEVVDADSSVSSSGSEVSSSGSSIVSSGSDVSSSGSSSVSMGGGASGSSNVLPLVCGVFGVMIIVYAVLLLFRRRR